MRASLSVQGGLERAAVFDFDREKLAIWGRELDDVVW